MKFNTFFKAAFIPKEKEGVEKQKSKFVKKKITKCFKKVLFPFSGRGSPRDRGKFQGGSQTSCTTALRQGKERLN